MGRRGGDQESAGVSLIESVTNRSDGVAFPEEVVHFALGGSPGKLVITVRLPGVEHSDVVLFHDDGLLWMGLALAKAQAGKLSLSQCAGTCNDIVGDPLYVLWMQP